MSDSLTTFSSKCEILADLWLNYRTEDNFADFIYYNDIGLPLAYAEANKLITLEKAGEGLVEETFDLLLEGLGLDDTGFDSLDDLLDTGSLLEQEDDE